MINMLYDIVIHRLPEGEGGGYVGIVPDLYGCMSDGDTPEETLENTKAAIDEWLDLHQRTGRPIPEPGTALKASKKERETLVATIHLLSTDLDQRIFDVEGQLRELMEEIQALNQRISWPLSATALSPTDDESCAI